MRAYQVHSHQPAGPEALRSVEVSIPEPRERELLVRIICCGLCRTDLHVLEGDLPHGTLPIIPGHQVVGIVEQCGPGCSAHSVGNRVGVPWLASTCGTCEYCLQGKENLCPNSRYTGYQRNGGYAEYMVADERYCYRIPEQFSDVEAAPLLCAGIIGYRALARARVPRGGKLAIYGFGSSALITAQIAQARGIELYVATRGATHHRLAKEFGVAWVGGATELPPVQVDSALIFAPAGEIVPVALRSLKRGGTVSIAGIHMSTIPALNYEEELFHEKTVTSVEANTREDGKAFLAEAASSKVKIQAQTFSFAECNQALMELKAGHLKGNGVLVWG